MDDYSKDMIPDMLAYSRVFKLTLEGKALKTLVFICRQIKACNSGEPAQIISNDDIKANGQLADAVLSLCQHGFDDA